jgi:hypothetical protein
MYLTITPQQEMITELKKFGFKDLSQLNQHTLFEMFQDYGDEKVRAALRITINKFKYKRASLKQFQGYWFAVTRNLK